MATKYWISQTTSGTGTSFSTAGNWSDGKAPANDDTLIFNASGTSNVEADLSTVLTGIVLVIEPSYEGRIGVVSATGAATYLVLDGGTLRMPRTSGGLSSYNGPYRVLVNFGSTAATVDIDTTNGTGAEGQYPPVMLKGTAITATVSGGNAGFAVRPGDTATLASLRVTRLPGGAEPTVYLGPGATTTEVIVEAGTVYGRSDQTQTLVRVAGGEYNHDGTGAHTALHVDAGTANYNGSGTITAGTVRGTLDLSACGGVTLTDCTVYKGGKLNCDNGKPGSIVFTNPIQYPDGLGEVTVKTPAGVKGSLVAI